MNLGQLIGELQIRAAGEVSGGLRVAPPPVGLKPMKTRSVNRQADILELIRAKGSVSYLELASALGITANNASVMLLTMCRLGRVRRSGTKGSYRYHAA